MQSLLSRSLFLMLLLAAQLNLYSSVPALGKSKALATTGKSAITFINESGVPALVKLVEPNRR